MDLGEKTSRLILLAQELAEATPGFFDVKGPGAGDRATNEFMEKLGRMAKQLFDQDYSQQKVCGRNNLSVDFYFRDEETVVEFAFSLDKPMNEYERDIFKCLLGADNGHAIRRLVLVCKPGGHQRMAAAGPSAIREWAQRRHGLEIESWDLVRPENQPG
jgi:hypothetical protein